MRARMERRRGWGQCCSLFFVKLTGNLSLAKENAGYWLRLPSQLLTVAGISGATCFWGHSESYTYNIFSLSGRPRRTYHMVQQPHRMGVAHNTFFFLERAVSRGHPSDDPSEKRGIILTTTVSPLPNEMCTPANVTTPCPDAFTKGDTCTTWLVCLGSSCPVPPENSKTPSPVKTAFAPKMKPPSLSHRSIDRRRGWWWWWWC